MWNQIKVYNSKIAINFKDSTTLKIMVQNKIRDQNLVKILLMVHPVKEEMNVVLLCDINTKSIFLSIITFF